VKHLPAIADAFTRPSLSLPRRVSIPVLALLTLISLAAPLLLAQGGRAANLVGKVLAPNGGGLVGAQVTLIAADGSSHQATTDGQGAFRLSGLPLGSGELAVTAPGFAPLRTAVLVARPAGAPLSLHLRVASLQQNVTVTSDVESVSLQPEDQAAAVVLKGDALKSLADDPDQLATDLAALAGPAVGGVGATIYIDGFTRGDIPPKSAIASIKVNDNPFSPEFNRLGYGRIQIQTKPGSQTLHGDLEYDGNTWQMNAVQPFLRASGAPPPPYHSNIYSADAGGPWGQRLSWFLSLERRDIDSQSVVNAQVLSPDFLPVGFISSVANPSHRTVITPRLDWQLSPNNILTARYQNQQSSQTGGGVGGLSLPSQAYDSSSRRHNLQVGDTQTLGSNGANRLRYQFVHIHDHNGAEGSGPTLQVLGAFTGGGNANGGFERSETHNDLREDLSLSRGPHQIQMGAEAADVARTETNTSNYNGSFVFSSLADYAATQRDLSQGMTMAQIQAAGYGPSQFSLAAGNPRAHINRLDASLYVLDAWQFRPHLMLDYGLRFETENIVHDKADWAPRLGLAWGLGQRQATVLRAGFGIFYERIDDDQMIVVAHLNGLNQQQYVVDSPSFYPNVPPPASLSSSTAALPTRYLYSPTLHAPPRMTTSLGLERQLGKAASLSLTYLHSYGWDQLLTNDLNAPLPGTYNPAQPGSGTRPYGLAAGHLYAYESRGVTRQNQFTLTFKYHGGPVSLNGNYTYNRAYGNTFDPDSFPTHPWNLNADYGPSPWDIRQRASFEATLQLPWGVTADPFVVAQSGTPYSLTLGQDLFGTGQQNARPALATSSSPAAEVLSTRYGTFNLAPGPFDAMIAPNTEVGPAAVAVNLRMMKDVGFGGTKETRFHLGAGFEARNLLNTVNLAAPVGNLLSPRLGQSVTLQGGEFSSGAANRRLDLILHFSF
jgi:hypothetical protein